MDFIISLSLLMFLIRRKGYIKMWIFIDKAMKYSAVSFIIYKIWEPFTLKFFILFYFLCVHACLYAYVPLWACIERTTFGGWFSASIMWILQIKLKFSGFVVGKCFTPEPFCQPQSLISSKKCDFILHSIKS